MKIIPQMEPVYGDEERLAMDAYLRSGGWLTEHKETARFAEMLSEYTGALHCLITNNGTVSLTLALLALGIGPGDEVMVPNFTMIATPNAVKMTGATPVLVDVESKTLCLSLERAAEKITSRTKAMIYVAFNGRAGDMKQVTDFAEKRGLFLIEDAAQALGARQNGRHLGTFGKVGSFSFSSPKIITTGQGGALVTSDPVLFERLKKLKDFGRTQGGLDTHDAIGYNFKFTDLQAVIGIEQMKRLPERVARKKAMFEAYRKSLAGVAQIEIVATDLNDVPPWFVDIYAEDPDGLAAALKAKGIHTRRIYPPIHSQQAYQVAGHFPVTESYAARGLWLPSSIRVTDEDIAFIAGAIKNFYAERK